MTPAEQYHAAPSEFPEAPAEELTVTTPRPTRAKLMAMFGELESLRAEFNALSDSPKPADEPDPLTGFTFPTREELTAMTDELATLRADNDALKAKWEAGHVEAMETRIALNQEAAQCDELRADNDARGALIEQLRAELACSEFANRQAIATATELDIVRSERDAALAELAKAERTINTMAVRLDLANAETERQQRLVTLFVRVLREMTPGDV